MQVKGHSPLLRRARDPRQATHCFTPPRQPSLAPTPETVSGIGTWHTRDQSQNQEDPNSVRAARTYKQRSLSAGVATKAE